MKALKALDNLRPTFSRGKLEEANWVWDANETFLFTPSHAVTRGPTSAMASTSKRTMFAW